MSYAGFNYNWMQKPEPEYSSGDSIRIKITLENTSEIDADEVAQLYIGFPELPRMPAKELKQFSKVQVASGKSTEIEFVVAVSDLKKWDESAGSWKVYPGNYTVYVGGDALNSKLSASFKLK